MTAPQGRIVRPATRAVTDYSAVLKQVQAAGLMSRRGGLYALRVGGVLAALAAVWTTFAIVGSGWWQVAVAAGLAVVTTQVMFLGHDAAHREIFRSGKLNQWAALLLGTGLGGVSLGWWNDKHNRHHQAPNQIGKDPDIVASLLRFYPADHPAGGPLLAMVYRRQGWWFFPLLLGEALHLHLRSIHAVVTRRGMDHRGWEAALLTVRLGGYPALLFLVLPWGVAATFLAVQLAVAGMYLGSAFSASHIGMPTVPKDGKIDFLRRQVLMSRNVAGGRIATLAMGGLNYQIEHHLFPAMPRPNLRKARPIVRAFCADRTIEYHEVPIYRAWAEVARHLNRVGIAAGIAAACPTAAALR